MYIDSKYKRCVANSSHSCHPHISYILTPGFLLHLDCALIVSGKQKILLFFAYCSQTTRLRGHCWAEVFWNIYLFFLNEISFFEKKCVLFYCISWKYLAYCIATGHLVLFIWSTCLEFIDFQQKQFEALHIDSHLIAVGPGIPEEHVKTKRNLTSPHYI